MNNSIIIADAFYVLRKELESVYEHGEATAIAHELMEYITGLGKLERVVRKNDFLNTKQQALLAEAASRAMSGEPLQYITGVQWFMGKPFNVNRHVLIPRPETEELVQWIADDHRGKADVAILDIGSGSGCIPVSLKLSLPGARVASCDISNDALEVAQGNAAKLDAEVTFFESDFLDANKWEQLPCYDVIVSNPPYIPISEKETLDKNVREFEPGTALFVPDDDALLFYRKIAAFGKIHLNAAGAIYCELHRDYAIATKELFEQTGYASVELRTDMHGNNRMLKAGLMQ